MRVVGLREGVDIGLEHVLAAGLLETLALVLVAFLQQLLDVLAVFAGQLQAQHLVFHALAPEIVQFGLILGPRSFLAVDQQAFVEAEVDLVDTLGQ